MLPTTHCGVSRPRIGGALHPETVLLGGTEAPSRWSSRSSDCQGAKG